MSSPRLSLELPADFEVSCSAGTLAAMRADVAAELRAAGYASRSEIATRTSDLTGRGALGELSIRGARFLQRRFQHGGLLRWLTGARFVDPERPFRELAVSYHLRRAGIATPPVVAARARRARGFGWHLDLVTERVEGCVEVAAALAARARGELEPAAGRRLARACGRFVATLHAAGLRHADLHPRNLLVATDSLLGGEPRLWVLDLDRASVADRLDEQDRVSCLARFYRYVIRDGRERGVHVARTDFARFLRGYEASRRRRRELWRAVEARFARSGALHAASWRVEALVRARRAKN